MQKHITNPYVSDGLISWWDGIWNIGLGKHSDTATSWKNLAGSPNLTIYGGGTWRNNRLECNGSVRAATATEAQAKTVLGQLQHWEAVIRLDTNNTFTALIKARNSSSTSAKGSIIAGVSHITSVGYRYCAQRTYPVAINSRTHSMSVNSVQRNAVINGYFDGQKITNYAQNYGGGDFGYGIGIGYANLNNYGTCCKGAVYCLRLYNRALTEEEVASNYAVDKQRFGF